MKLTNINKYFGNKHVLKNTTLDFPAGQTTVMVGPSGSGKSTILRSLNLLVIPESGQYDFGKHHLDFSHKVSNKTKLAIRRETGMVFQDYNLFPNKTVLQNITEGPIQVLKQPKQAAIRNAQKLLVKVGLANYGDAYPHELSGGQAQRVAIARALAMNPKYILLDEPTSALDPELELSVLKVLSQLAAERQSMVIVTHNMIFAKRVADRIIFVENGEILYDGTPEEFFAVNNPNQRIKNFISSMTMEDL
ncbi:amino acid ABC transporter ATP-binding protein [Limosilactobacillus sp. STM2_1]|uniref:Amino acid ABC transporter ATP-binding protein n=1 Tax=Limosilactobacillus rudii TaxID=2759755 RepID=A0A7W3YPK1_9LACO|nr:amino acid ABC transporter ATP-binding protein [Limosilactobacillus rudii]MBB1080436.1 amino acid ABC transporter ATP-binding protein [Limosilactobacillus rudii]MBB1098462.1 amino acid ABC transporter ATP-binding protein [Limosilactobacillus rudii]MCD7135470.1 amino acid ABC transporter ATP-binding protein [Limosilactobacillus rudii]